MNSLGFQCQSCGGWTHGSMFNPSFCNQCAQFYVDYDLAHSHHFLISSREGSINHYNSSLSSSGSPDIPTADIQLPQARKRRLPSDSSDESQALVRIRGSRKLRDSQSTAKVREKRACFQCMKKRKECLDGDDPDGDCQRCLKHGHQITYLPGLEYPICWRPNISTELFRRGPTIDFAVSQRGNVADAGAGRQALWKHFRVAKVGKQASRVVELSQGWTADSLKIQLDIYKPKESDKQYYTWFDHSVAQQYDTPPYGIANLQATSSAIRNFLLHNFDAYIEAHMRDANSIARTTFKTAQANKLKLPLVELALELWVGCRFIEEPWSIVGAETLGLALHPSPNCPYHDRIPVPPIVDLQIDLVVINDLLQPKLKEILRGLKIMLESSDPWSNWFEINLAYFILLHNVELTMAHDAWFVKRNNLQRKYSNKALVDTIMHSATTLLTCFHYAHQGFAPFLDPKLAVAQKFSDEAKTYLDDVRPKVLSRQKVEQHDPAEDLFWTSQLHQPNWRPVSVEC